MVSERLNLALNAAFEAGQEIMRVYNSDNFEIEIKNDNSPLTLADRLSHKIIKNLLIKTALPIISEEGKDISYEERKKWDLFWMIDPIDGTKEFIKRNGEFTVNIALIEFGQPILGVVYAPALKVMYFAEKDYGSFKKNGIKSMKDFKNKKSINLNQVSYPKSYTFVVSKSHMNKETQNYINEEAKKHENISSKSFGSSLKICKVADGEAHCYPRFGPTMEWDTAAAHAVAKFAGCSLFKAGTYQQLSYNKQNLLNPFFILKSK